MIAAPRGTFSRDGLVNSSHVKIPEAAFDRFHYLAGQGNRSPPGIHRKAYQGPKVSDQRITLIFQIEFEPLGRKYRCASRRPGIPSGKCQGRTFEQENSADLSLDVAGEPETFLVAADEECRNRRIDDAGIERLKRRVRGCGLRAG